MSAINHPNVCDKGLEWVKNNTTKILACSSQPVDFADAVAKTVGSADTAPTDFTISNGDTAGSISRKIVNEIVVGEVTLAGENQATYVVWVSETEIIIGQDAVPQTLVFGNPLTFPPRKREIQAQPT